MSQLPADVPVHLVRLDPRASAVKNFSLSGAGRFDELLTSFDLKKTVAFALRAV
jgi:hypothetical protein